MGRPKGQSMFNPYLEQISEWLEVGWTHGMIADKLSEITDCDVAITSIYYFCKVNDLKSRVTQGAKNGRIDIPHCDDCSECVRVWNTLKTSKHRVCKELMSMISPACLTSPMECPRRENLCTSQVKRSIS